MSPIIIGVDTGNRQIKTATQVFTSGIQVSDTQSGIFQDNDTIRYGGQYYTPTMARDSYKRDKTIDDDYFVLTLFAVVRELRERGIDPARSDEPTTVVLVVGLPPAHLVRQKDRFREYFNRGEVSFEYNGSPIVLDIVNVHVLIQGYSAILGSYSEIRKLKSAYIIDIGGYTTDVIGVLNGNTNPSICFSEDDGMIHLYNRIHNAMNVKFDSVPSESQIEELLTDPSYGDELDEGMADVASEQAREYVKELLLKLREKKVDLRLSKGIFVGGGSSRLKAYIESSELVRNPMFITDIKANAIGYETIVRFKYSKRG